MDGTTTSLVLRQDEGDVATLTLNRPEVRKGLAVAVMNAVQEQREAIATDKGVKVVVLAGAGPGFCAGHDLREMRANPGKQYY